MSKGFKISLGILGLIFVALATMIIFPPNDETSNSIITNNEGSSRQNEEQLILDKKSKSNPDGLSNSGKIRCEKFDIKHSISGEKLTFSIDTDLPDFTTLMVSVRRSYKEKGDDNSTYLIDYLSEKGTVKEWREPREISIADRVFQVNLQEKMDEMAGFDMAFQVSTVSSQIEVSFVVPVNQKNTAFGSQNENLESSLISPSGLRVIEKEIIINKPIGSSVQNIKSNITSANKLELGKSYRISKETPLMPEFEPSNPIEALSRTKKLPSGSKITIISIETKNNTLWYQVRAYTPSGQSIGTGWINSIALIGQEIKIEVIGSQSQ